MRKLLTILVVVVIMRSVCGSQERLTTPAEDDRRQMELLLSLHVENCAYISLCTVPGTNLTLELGEGRAPCCHHCSCNPACEISGNCCPDYPLYKIIGTAGFTNVTDVVQAMEELGMFNNTEEAGTDHENSSHKNCIHAGLSDALNVPRGQDYMMVTSCPDGTSAKNETVQKCQQVDGSITSITPVYCSADKTTYRNIHCLQCHGHNVSTATYWNSVVKCSKADVVIFKHFEGPEDVNSALKQGSMLPSCNIVFTPDSMVVATRCTVVDVTECPHATSGRDYGAVCRDHSLPVDHLNGLVTTRYNNIACFYCNNPYLSYREGCKQRMLSSQLNLRLNRGDSVSNKSTSLDTAINKGGSCQKGYVFDTETSECRRILCPNLMYRQAGGCVPLYSTIQPAFYSFMMKATYTQKTEALRNTQTLRGRGEQFRDESEFGLLSTIRDCLKHDDSYDVDFSVHAKLKGSGDPLTKAVQYYFVYVKFWYPGYGGEYLQAAKQGQAMLASMSRLKVNTLFGTVYFKTSLFSGVLVRHGTGQVSDTVSELQSLQDLAPVRVFTSKTRGLPGMEVPLSISSFCYRIELKYNEMRFQRAYYNILRTGEKVYPVDFQTDFGTGAPLICVQSLLREYASNLYIKSDVGNGDNGAQADVSDIDVSDADEQQGRSSIEIASFISFGVLLVLIVVVAVMKKRCR